MKSNFIESQKQAEKPINENKKVSFFNNDKEFINEPKI